MIRVVVQKNRLDTLGHETLVGGRIVRACKDAGMPIEGVFALRGVTHGQLVYHNEEGLDGPEHVITWREDADDTDKTFTRSSGEKGVTVYRSGRHLIASRKAAVVEEDDL